MSTKGGLKSIGFLFVLFSHSCFAQPDSLFKSKALKDAGTLSGIKTTGGIHRADTAEKINEFIFSIQSRTSRTVITIVSDSATDETVNRFDPAGSGKRGIKLRKTDWQNLLNSISAYRLSELVNLPSPTNARTYDGANGSTIEIRTNRARYSCGEFDNYNPDEKLKKLLSLIREIDERP